MLSRRDGTIFGLCRTKGISGLGSVVLNPYVPVLTGFSKKEGEMKFKKTRVGLFTDVTSLDYLITLPESKEIQDNLQLIDQMGNFGRVLDGSSEISTEEEGGSLMYRANLWRRFKYQHASELFDPDEIERLNALSSFYSSSSQTIRFVRDYVLHFSKLFLEGLFGDTQNSNVLICVKGPKEEDKVYIYDAMTNELRYNLGKCPPRECEEEFKHRLKNLEEFFAKETPGMKIKHLQDPWMYLGC